MNEYDEYEGHDEGWTKKDQPQEPMLSRDATVCGHGASRATCGECAENRRIGITRETLADRQLNALDRVVSDVRMLVETWESVHEERMAELTELRALERAARALIRHVGTPGTFPLVWTDPHIVGLREVLDAMDAEDSEEPRHAFDLEALVEAFDIGDEDAAIRVVREHFEVARIRAAQSEGHPA